MTGSITFNWKLPDWPAIVIVASLPMTCAATIATASGITGFTLPGMMLLPGCSAGSEISAEACERSAVHPAQVVRDLEQAHGGGLQDPRHLDRRVLRAHRLEEVVERVEADLRALRERGRELLGELVDAR